MKLFISYAHTDRWQVNQIVSVLKSGGHDPWFDEQLLPGDDWKKRLLTAIQDCEIFVYVLSPESVESEWCQWEFARAIELDKAVLPILIQSPIDLPDLIAQRQYVDFSKGMTPESVSRLMGGITQIAIQFPVNAAPAAPAAPDDKPAQAEEPLKHVFISYSQADLDIMHRARADLKQAGIPVWTDESIKTGASFWQGVIEDAIENAGCLLMLMSPDAKTSDWVRRELSYAAAREIPIYPALVRGDELSAIPLNLMDMQYADLRSDYETRMPEVIRGIYSTLSPSAPPTAQMPAVMETAERSAFDPGFWDRLFRMMERERCTPILGSALDDGTIKSRTEIARIWAEKHNYPFAAGYDRDLARVAHFLTVDLGGPFLTKDDFIATWLGDITAPDFSLPNQSHSMLAALNFPLYITTNYNDFMFRALRHHGKDPQRVYYFDDEWVSSPRRLEDDVSIDTPMVFHVYGHQEEPESLILSEDDYLHYLVQMTRENVKFPTSIVDAIGKHAFLFIGFTVTDWNLRILFHILSNFDRKGKGPHIAVQLEPTRDLDTDEQRQRVQGYLEQTFSHHLDTPHVSVYVGDTKDFISELKAQWDKTTR